jgi:hypothetical protein
MHGEIVLYYIQNPWKRQEAKALYKIIKNIFFERKFKCGTTVQIDVTAMPAASTGRESTPTSGLASSKKIDERHAASS